MTILRALVFLPLFLCLAGLTGCAGPSVMVSRTSMDYLDTVVTLRVCAATEAEGQRALDGCFRLVQTYHTMLDADGDGALGRLNRGETVELPDEMVALFAQALSWCRNTGGALDVTMWPLCRLWGFGTAQAHVPSQEAIVSARAHCGYTALPALSKTYTLPSEWGIDLGAVAKGALADALANYLHGVGINSALIDLGGNVLALGTKVNGQDWRVGVQSPDGGLLATVLLRDCAAVTSGSYQRYFEENGTRYHHILDAETGYPADSGLSAVTVLSGRAMDADCLSTALFVLGTERGISLLRDIPGVYALFLSADGTMTLSDGLTLQDGVLCMPEATDETR